MDLELQNLAKRLEKLVLQRSQITTELASVDKEIAAAIIDRNNKQRELSLKKAATTQRPIVIDSQGDRIDIGDHVETLTRGKYYEKRGRVIALDAKKGTVTIRYISSKKETWRKGYNVRRTSK